MNQIKRRWKSWRTIVLGFVAVTLGGFLNRAWSEDLPPPVVSPAPPAVPSIDLEQRVKILERRLEIADENAARKTKETTVLEAGNEGFQLKAADKTFVLKIRGLLQADSRQFIDDKAGMEVNQFLVRRARPILEGTVFENFSFRITPDFSANGKTVLFDAYLDIAPWSFAKLRVGKFKPPIGQEHLQPDEYLTFAERGFPALLSPSRDTGLQLSGDLAGGIASYAAALTNGVGDNNVNTVTAVPVASDTDNTDSKEVTARLALRPFKNKAALFAGLGVGFAGSYAGENNTLPNYVTPGQIAIFALAAPGASAPVPDGAKTRFAPDINWYYHSLAVYGEYIRSSQVYRVANVKSKIVNQAGQVGLSYVLTGEDASYGGVKPRRALNVRRGTWGAFELGARYNVLCIDPDAYTRGIVTVASSVQRATAWGVGLNWYLNNAIRFTTDYEQTSFDKGAATGDRSNEKVLISRWQLLF